MDDDTKRARKACGAYAASLAVQQRAGSFVDEYVDAVNRAHKFNAKMTERKTQPCDE